MRILIVLIPVSIILLGFAVWAFVWAVRRGQFDDLDTPAISVLADDDLPPPPAASHHGDKRDTPPAA